MNLYLCFSESYDQQAFLIINASFPNFVCLSDSLAAQTPAANAIQRTTDNTVEIDVLVLSAQCYRIVTNGWISDEWLGETKHEKEAQMRVGTILENHDKTPHDCDSW